MPNKRKLVYLYENEFLKKDFERYGLKYYLKKNIIVEIWDLTPHLKKNYFKKIRLINDLDLSINNFVYKFFHKKDSIIAALNSESKSSIFISFLENSSDTQFIFTELNKINHYWGVLHMSSYPNQKLNFKEKIKLGIKNPNLIYKKFINKVLNNLDNYQFQHNPKFVILAGQKSKIPYQINSNTNIKNINVHNFNYDNFLDFYEKNFVDDSLPKYKYWAYIDEMVPYHSDMMHMGIAEPICEEDIYYEEINIFFNRIEKLTGIKILILGYQKAKYLKIDREKLFQGRKIIYDKTNESVKNSHGVLMHNSTAVSFPVIYKKNIIFLLSENYNLLYKKTILALASELGKDPINISNLGEIDFTKNINREKYDQFFRKYINNRKKIDNLKSYEIIYKELFT